MQEVKDSIDLCQDRFEKAFEDQVFKTDLVLLEEHARSLRVLSSVELERIFEKIETILEGKRYVDWYKFAFSLDKDFEKGRELLVYFFDVDPVAIMEKSGKISYLEIED